jgi:predicted molibdopterin-dependent oxidoreductase YjgC
MLEDTAGAQDKPVRAGASDKPSHTRLGAHQLTTCTFCGVGCGIYLESAGAAIAGAYPSMSHPANQGRICVRGWHVHEVASSPDRLKKPLIRRNGALEPASWKEAYEFAAERLKAVKAQHGPDSIGFVTSPRCSNEETYLLQKLARSVVGTNNVVHGLGLHRQTSIQVLRDMLGVPAATNSISELSKSEVIVVDGIDLGKQLPTIGGWVIRAKLAGAKLIATGTRGHRVAEHADHFLQIRPNTDLLLYGAMAKVIVDRGLMNVPFIQAHCRDYEKFLETIQDFDVLWAASECGVSPEAIEEAALTYGRAKSAMILYSTGVEARGVDTVGAIVNLALLTGNLGKEGAGIMPLAEHNNLQGGCDMGMLPECLPGYAHVEDAAARQRLGALWNATLPDKPGVDLAEALGVNGGRIRALWLDRHDPLRGHAEAHGATLAKLDLVIAQQMFTTEVSQHAHVVLPVAAFGEEQVSYTSTERRVQLTAKAAEPPSGVVPAWLQIVRVAQRLGAGWEYESSAAVMDEIGQAVPAYAGATHENLAREYGRQWPCTHDKPLGTRFFFEDGLPAKGFHFVAIERPAAPPSPPAEYPFVALLGHSLYYWHRNVLIQHSETLKREYGMLLLDYPEGFVEINADDATRLGIRDGSRIRLVTEHGSGTSAARPTNEVKSGSVFVPFFLHALARALMSASHVEGDEQHPLFVRVEKV